MCMSVYLSRSMLSPYPLPSFIHLIFFFVFLVTFIFHLNLAFVINTISELSFQKSFATFDAKYLFINSFILFENCRKD